MFQHLRCVIKVLNITKEIFHLNDVIEAFFPTFFELKTQMKVKQILVFIIIVINMHNGDGGMTRIFTRESLQTTT